MEVKPLPLYARFYIYAIHGYVTEVMFTALWEFVVNLNWKFPGNTSVWAMPIYGISVLVIEQLSIFLQKHKIPLVLRGLIYVLWTYTWEFSTGYILKQFNACPWDYTPFEGDFMGLVTLEYAPLWFLGGICSERYIVWITRSLYYGPSRDDSDLLDLNGQLKMKSS